MLLRADGGADQPADRARLSGFGRASRKRSYERGAVPRLHHSEASVGRHPSGRLWFFAGYRSCYDDDSQRHRPGAFPRTCARDKGLRLTHVEMTPPAPGAERPLRVSLNPDRPDRDAARSDGPAAHLGAGDHLWPRRHFVSPSTVWDIAYRRFVYSQDDDARFVPWRADSTGRRASRLAPARLTRRRSSARRRASSVTTRADVLGADHLWKAGGQFGRGERIAIRTIPTGVDSSTTTGLTVQAVSSEAASLRGDGRHRVGLRQ